MLVYNFRDGDRSMANLLGGKGANLAEMTKLGLPVPPGFTITTEACRHYLAQGTMPDGLEAEITLHVSSMEQSIGRTLGNASDPLLVSVRSGARFSMPGMMETVLNIGLNDQSVEGLAQISNDPRFAWDAYRRLLQMFGKTVLNIEGEQFEHLLDAMKEAAGVATDVELSRAQLQDLVAQFKDVIARESGSPFPQDSHQQLMSAVRAVFGSWNTERAILYRRREGIPADLGTAVNVQAMAFGNVGEGSGTGVAFTRDPGSGENGLYGDYLPDAQGEDVVSGIRNTLALDDLEGLDKPAFDELLSIMKILESHYRDICDIEFTIERHKLWMLQTRVGKRTAGAAFRIAIQLVDEGVISMDEAVERVSGSQLAQLMFPQFAANSTLDLLAKGTNASPGAAVGKVVFDSATAIDWAARGDDVILVRRETNPDDLGGMVAAVGILTSRGGKTSHAAVVARGMGKTAVCGVESIDVRGKDKKFRVGEREISEGDVISIDGSTGDVFLGEVPVVQSPVVRYFEEGLAAAIADADEATVELVRAVDRIMRHADEKRRLRVRTNADNGPDAARARRMGAQGIGLLRTEHMFLGEQKKYIEKLILANTEQTRQSALEALLPLQIADFTEVLEAMDGLPVTIRLIDPPLHEFLPDRTELAVEVALANERGQVDEEKATLYHEVNRLAEQNPMLGLRGVRLGLVLPGLFALQVRAICEAACALRSLGKDPRVEIMIPLVAAAAELEITREEVESVVAEVESKYNCPLDVLVGTMIELPRAALTAERIAESAEFFSFGTNDLTQTTWGFSRDDVEASFFSPYLEMGIFSVSPFESIDREGVGQLVRIAVEKGRSVRPGLHCGVCGEHGGDPASVHFFDEVGLDYVSCSPFRVPVARLEAARSAIARSGGVGSDTR
ncbi:MAG: pyruvate, phosphate dikinase [Candidatus Nanopelagicales bacterium]